MCEETKFIAQAPSPALSSTSLMSSTTSSTASSSSRRRRYKLGGNLASGFGTQRGSEIDALFFASEDWALQDWKEVRAKLSPLELACLEPDIVLRTIRGSRFLPQPNRRVNRDVQLLRNRVLWYRNYKVGEFNFEQGNEKMTLNMEPVAPVHPDFTLLNISTGRIELFRHLCMPLKMYGVSIDKVPIIKFSLNETNWTKAREIFTDETELQYLLLLLLESLMRKVKLKGSKGKCNSEEDAVFVSGKYIMIVDLEGLSMSHFTNAVSLGLKSSFQMMSKFYPETLLKTYLVNSYFIKAAINLIRPFVSKDTLERINVCRDERECYDLLVSKDKLPVSQIPVEYGGGFEGAYTIDLAD